MLGYLHKLDPVPPDILDQFSTIPLPSEVGAWAAHTLAIRSDFQHINQDWILLNCQPEDVMAAQPQMYQLKTPAEKFTDLAGASCGVGALAIIHWVATVSDGGEPQFTSPVAMVLGPLINSPQLGEDVGHDLSELGLDFTVPAVPLGKTWPSHRIYLLITPLLGNTRAKGAHKLVRMWDNDWPSIYQFDHGLKACRSIAIADTPDKEQEAALSAHPLWTPLSGSQHTLPLATTADRPRLTTPCEGEVLGMWTLSKLLLLPLGGNLPIGFGMAVNELFSRETFLIQLATDHGQSLASHVEGWLQAPWCDSWFNGARRDTKNFVLPVVSWSQLRDTLAPLVVPDDSVDPRRYAFLVLMWQGIARLHTDKLTYRTLPGLTDYVRARMRRYFEK